jgi:hypothetical protein
MAGFFGLFNSKTKYVDEADTEDVSNSSEEFFLEPDEAKSLGNINSRSKSAVGKSQVSQEQTDLSPTVKTEKHAQTDSTINERRRPDDSMDLFRNMAREIKK